MSQITPKNAVPSLLIQCAQSSRSYWKILDFLNHPLQFTVSSSENWYYKWHCKARRLVIHANSIHLGCRSIDTKTDSRLAVIYHSWQAKLVHSFIDPILDCCTPHSNAKIPGNLKWYLKSIPFIQYQYTEGGHKMCHLVLFPWMGTPEKSIHKVRWINKSTCIPTLFTCFVDVSAHGKNFEPYMLMQLRHHYPSHLETNWISSTFHCNLHILMKRHWYFKWECQENSLGIYRNFILFSWRSSCLKMIQG